IVLGVGLDVGSRTFGDDLAAFASDGIAGLVVKGDAAKVAPAVRSSSIAVLAVPNEMSWAQLHTLLRSARAVAGHPSDGGPQGGPVGDLFALANAVAAMVGGPATIEDVHSTVLAYSNHDQKVDEARRET